MMAGVKVKRNKKNRNIILKLSVLVFALWAVFQLVSNQVALAAKERENNEILAQIEKQKQENEERQKIIDNDDMDNYIKERARENGYIDPDEHVYANKAGN